MGQPGISILCCSSRATNSPLPLAAAHSPRHQQEGKTPACFNQYIDNTKAKFRVYQALFISKTCTCHIMHSRRGFQPFHILMWWITLCYWATLRSNLSFGIKSLTTAALRRRRREKRSIKEIHWKISFYEWGGSNFVSKGADLSCAVYLCSRLL